MKKFRAKMNVNPEELKKHAAGHDDDELDEEAIFGLKKQAYEKRVQEQLAAFTGKDYTMKPNFVKMITDNFSMEEGPRSRIEKIDNSVSLVEAINKLLEAESKAFNVYNDA